ncbi:postacrosomal sheath WW domain-binding protein [Periophthalmus magnuspinnatus]|uniref:postacrosomal sheath WW domain-binding protein n=1 Tax=Periophthalmus magnuspinnatus TaxID=409849 RepID=UPI00145B2494|nr:postacrosomal sheath WW domain-binding protein [Periophthalmus magnuspinnatus]
MALNRNHSQNGGVLINNGESIVRECKSVELQLSDVKTKADLLKGSKKGNVYLTPYRLVFVSTNAKDHVVSAMFPYHLMKGCSIEQPVFGANYIKGNVLAEYGGGWEGTAQFKMTFMSGGAIDFGQYLFKLATNASRAPPAQNGAAAYGYPSPVMINSYGPPAPPPAYPYPGPPQPNGYYPAPPPAAANMAYPYPPPAPEMFPSGYNYMAPPPYPGPPQNWTAPPVTAPPATAPPGNSKAAEAAASAYYDPSNPHTVYMPMERPPPYAPNSPEKKQN